MRQFPIDWYDILINEDKKKKEKQSEYPRPFVQPSLPIPPPERPKDPREKEKKDDDGVIIIDI